jgi:hypothetical protein
VDGKASAVPMLYQPWPLPVSFGAVMIPVVVGQVYAEL